MPRTPSVAETLARFFAAGLVAGGLGYAPSGGTPASAGCMVSDFNGGWYYDGGCSRSVVGRDRSVSSGESYLAIAIPGGGRRYENASSFWSRDAVETLAGLRCTTTQTDCAVVLWDVAPCPGATASTVRQARAVAGAPARAIRLTPCATDP